MKKEIIERAKQVMKDQGLSEVFVTSDNEIFISKNRAENNAWREHGKIRENKLKVETITASSVGLKGTEKVEDTPEVSKEDFQEQYDELFGKHEKAETSVKEKEIAFNTAKQEAAKAKGTDKETEMNELEKKAQTALKSATTKKDNLSAALKEAEAKLDELED